MSLYVDIEGRGDTIVLRGTQLIEIREVEQRCPNCMAVMVDVTKDDPEVKYDTLAEHCGTCGSTRVRRESGAHSFGAVLISDGSWLVCIACGQLTPDADTQLAIEDCIQKTAAPPDKPGPDPPAPPPTTDETPRGTQPRRNTLDTVAREAPSSSNTTGPVCHSCGRVAVIILNDAGDGHSLGGACSLECLQKIAVDRMNQPGERRKVRVVEARDEGGAI